MEVHSERSLKTFHGSAEQPFGITTRVLDFVQDAFNALQRLREAEAYPLAVLEGVTAFAE